MARSRTLAYVVVLCICAVLRATPPRVVTSTIEDGQDDVNPAVTELRVTFNQAMNPGGRSIIGGGDTFPQITAEPRWVDGKTIAIPIALEPDHEYWLSINSDTFGNFANRGGESAVPQPISFRTRAAAAPADPAILLTPERNRQAVDALKKAIENDYAYVDRLKLNWDTLFVDHTDAMLAASTPNGFARSAVKLLKHAEDAHVYVQAADRTIATHFNPHPPNFNFNSIQSAVSEWKDHTGIVTGKLAGDIAYLLIAEWSDAATKSLEQAWDEVKNAKSLVVDVRMNGGGDEIIARRFAGRFIDEPKVYSRNRIRRNGAWEGPFDRIVEPGGASERYAGDVAVLIGPKVASNCESFVLMMKQNPRCKLIGAPTKGSSGNPKPHDLGNGVTVYLSSWEDQTPEGKVFEGKGVQPDVPVKTTLNALRQRDAVIEAAIRALQSPPAPLR